MNNSPRLDLPYLAPAQAQKHVTVNESLRRLDALVHLTVLAQNQSTPPGAPADADAYILGPNPAGAWGSFSQNHIAVYQDGAWAQLTPVAGMKAWVTGENVFYVYDGAGWTQFVSGGGGDQTTAPLFGVNATADSYNRFLVKSDGILFSHDDVTPGSGDCRVSLNKAGAGNTGSFLFQSNWSARAEFGLTGSDNFQLKVSPDGAAWRDAISISKDNGSLRIGAPTGGYKGAGTINAEGVYDDNSLLSCYVFDQALEGAIDVRKWDKKFPNRIIPAKRDGNGKVLEAGREIVRTHAPMRKFRTRIGSEYNPLTLDGYARHWKEKRNLTSMPNEDKFDVEKGMATGEWIQRLVETVEIQAVLIDQLNQKVEKLARRSA